MKKKLLLSMLFLSVGVGMQAQSVAEEQMDERFNDETKLPYGWFTEGWTVKDGVIQTNASSGFSFDISELLGTFGQKNTEETGTEDPEQSGGGNNAPKKVEGEGTGEGEGAGNPEGGEPEEKGEGTGTGGFDISKLLESLMGGGSKDNYLLTPPLVVNDGETLVFSAKKGKSDSGSGMSISFGASDSTFVVERSEYSKNEWVRVADLTTELDTLYKTFTITGTPAGEYRFRFKAGGTVMIDSVAGMHIDNEAPDLYIIENDARAYHIDLGYCTEDSTRTLQVINTATGTLNLTITSDDAALFTVNPGEMVVAAADTTDVSITFNFAAGQPGKNEAGITFTPADERVYGKTLRATAVVTQPGVWVEDFNTNMQPKGFFTEGWEFHDQVATTSSGSGGLGGMFGGGGSTSFLMTPPLKVESTDEVLLFSAKGSGDDSMAGLGSLLGGSSSSIVVEKSIYGSNKWEKVKEFDEALASDYKTLWVGYIEPGEYRFRIIASDSIVVDSIAGFHLDENAPDIYVLRNNTAATGVNFGMPQANSTETFAVVNTGTGSLQVGVATTNESAFNLSAKDMAIEANDTVTVDVIYVFDQESLGIHQGAVTFIPTTEMLAPLSYPLTAYSTYADAWTEDFEPAFLPEDETRPIPLPEGWTTTGWEVSMPSSGGGLMDMLGGLMGGSGEAAPKTYMANTSSDAYELITPRLQAKKGDVLRFYAELGGGGGLMDMLGGLMGGAAGGSGQLNVYYSRDNDDNWTYYDTFIQNGYAYFVAPYTGVYQLLLTSSGASVDNFYGFRKPVEEIALYDGNDDSNAEVLEVYDGQTVNVSYDRVLAAADNGDGTFTPCAFTICLPYDFSFSEYAEPGKVKLYQLSFIDYYYNQFIFTSVADKAEAGRAYLAVVEHGDMRMDAVGVTLTSQPIADEKIVVNNYEDWFFNDNLTKAGQWTGNFRSISATEADATNMFCLLDDGTWTRFTSQDNEGAKLNAFRAYFLADAAADAGEGASKTRAQAPANKENMMFRTMFSNAGVGSVPDVLNMLFEADIPTPSPIATGIRPTIQTIETDGTSRYFDLQGRMLNGKPDKGLYIENGKKMFR